MQKTGIAIALTLLSIALSAAAEAVFNDRPVFGALGSGDDDD